MRLHDKNKPMRYWLDFKRNEDGSVRIGVGCNGLHMNTVELSALDVALLKEVL